MELAATRRILAVVPDEHADWKPHAKSFSLGALAAHLSNVTIWGTVTMTMPELDLSGPDANQGMQREYPGRDELLAHFDRHAAAFRAAVVAADDAAFLAPWTLRHGGQAFFTMPRVAVLRSFVMNHMIHHRGQLTVYLRMHDVPLPELYGPTADSPRG